MLKEKDWLWHWITQQVLTCCNTNQPYFSPDHVVSYLSSFLCIWVAELVEQLISIIRLPEAKSMWVCLAWATYFLLKQFMHLSIFNFFLFTDVHRLRLIKTYKNEEEFWLTHQKYINLNILSLKKKQRKTVKMSRSK